MEHSHLGRRQDDHAHAFPGQYHSREPARPGRRSLRAQLWKPNSPGIGPYHVNNYSVSLPIQFPYKNFSDRADYNITDKLRVSGRFSMFRTPVTSSNPTGSDYFVSDRGSNRDAKSITGDVTYTLSPSTVLNVRGDYHSFVDQSKYLRSSPSMAGSKIWPNNDFYKTAFQDPACPVQLPRMSITGADGGTRNFNMGPGGGYWNQKPTGNSFNVKIAQQRGRTT